MIDHSEYCVMVLIFIILYFSLYSNPNFAFPCMETHAHKQVGSTSGTHAHKHVGSTSEFTRLHFEKKPLSPILFMNIFS